MSLTIEEHYKLHGNITPEQTESLLECQNVLANMTYVNDVDIRAGFPDEDFLESVFGMLRTLEKRLRGDNKLALGAIIEELDSIALQTARSVEYGLEEWKKCKRANND
jgi:hypothetical protein